MSRQPSYETDRLILRPYEGRDADRVLDIHSRVEVIRWFSEPPYKPMKDLDEARAWIGKWPEMHERDPRLGGWAIEIRDTGAVAGSLVIVNLPNSKGLTQIGWHLHPDSVGNGYVTEAARLMIDIVFGSGLDELWCDMFQDNAPSAAVARRLGLPELGVIDDPWYGNQSLIFKLTHEQWAARP